MLQYPWHKLNREKVVAYWWTQQPIGLSLSQDAFSFWFGSRIRVSIRLTNYLECQPESSFFRLHCAFANVLTYFSSKCVTTIQSLLTRAIDRFLGGRLFEIRSAHLEHMTQVQSALQKQHFDTCPRALSHGKTSVGWFLVYLLTIP